VFLAENTGDRNIGDAPNSDDAHGLLLSVVLAQPRKAKFILSLISAIRAVTAAPQLGGVGE
jgi:hypothetical protein